MGGRLPRPPATCATARPGVALPSERAARIGAHSREPRRAASRHPVPGRLASNPCPPAPPPLAGRRDPDLRGGRCGCFARPTCRPVPTARCGAGQSLRDGAAPRCSRYKSWMTPTNRHGRPRPARPSTRASAPARRRQPIWWCGARRGLLKNWVVGTTAEWVVRAAAAARLCRLPTCYRPPPYGRVLAIVDMSEASARALRAARTALGLFSDGAD